jgi:site-specific DNA-methyltransferase (adenine-specific)
MLFCDDNLSVLKGLDDSTVDLIYLDPPFFSQRDYRGGSIDDKRFQFSDTWLSINDYLTFLEVRIKECYRILKQTGSIFFHCDRSASHHIRVMLDGVFGSQNFRSEIVWSYKRWSNSKKGLLNAHQVIFFYSKSSDYKFNTIYTGYSPTTNVDQILQSRKRNDNGKCVYVDKNEDIYREKIGVPLSDVWEIPFLNPKAKERTGFPTQKPILLLERIISICTNEGDLVLDPFCGSGTTLVAAKLMNRGYIGIDNMQEAITLTRDRLEKPMKTSSTVLEKGVEHFNVQDEKIATITSFFGAVLVQRNRGIDAFLKEAYLNRPVALKIQMDTEDVSTAKNRLINAAKKKDCRRAILFITVGLLTEMESYEQYGDLELICLHQSTILTNIIGNLAPKKSKLI